MVEITYQMVLSTLQTVGILVGIVYYITIMRNAQRTRELTLQSQELTQKAQEQALETRQAQLFMVLYDHYNSIDYKKQAGNMYFQWEWSDVDEFMERYGPDGDADNYAVFSSVTSFYDGIGVLVKNGLVDANLVSDIMSGSITRLWETFEPAIRGVRERYEWP